MAQQFARPNSLVTSVQTTSGIGSNGWGTTWENLDETSADDTDIISVRLRTGGVSPATPSITSATVIFGLSTVSDPLSSSGHTLRYRISALSDSIFGGFDVGFMGALYQGATLIAASSVSTLTPNASPTWRTAELSLTAAQANSITDYSALRFLLNAKHAAVAQDPPIDEVYPRCSWVEFAASDTSLATPTGLVITPRGWRHFDFSWDTVSSEGTVRIIQSFGPGPTGFKPRSYDTVPSTQTGITIIVRPPELELPPPSIMRPWPPDDSVGTYRPPQNFCFSVQAFNSNGTSSSASTVCASLQTVNGPASNALQWTSWQQLSRTTQGAASGGVAFALRVNDQYPWDVNDADPRNVVNPGTRGAP